MTKEKLLARIKLLEDERLKCMQTFNAIEGAIQDNKYWLDNLESDPLSTDSKDKTRKRYKTMVNVAHSMLTGSNLHEPKGVAAAAAGEVYVANGAGSGVWTASGTVVSGMVADFFTPVAPTGWLELDGSTISTTTYAALFTVLTIQQTGSRGSASPLITALSSTANMRVGYNIFGTGITAGTTIISIDSSTQVTMSANASSSGTATVIVSPCVLASGTFTLPDVSTAGRFRRSRTSSSAIGVTQADQNKAHTHGVSGNTAAEAAHTHTGTTGTESATHTHTYTAVGGANADLSLSGPLSTSGAQAGTATGTESATHTHTFTSAAGSSHLHAISLTSASDGGTEVRPLGLVVMTCIKT